MTLLEGEGVKVGGVGWIGLFHCSIIHVCNTFIHHLLLSMFRHYHEEYVCV